MSFRKDFWHSGKKFVRKHVNAFLVEKSYVFPRKLKIKNEKKKTLTVTENTFPLVRNVYKNIDITIVDSFSLILINRYNLIFQRVLKLLRMTDIKYNFITYFLTLTVVIYIRLH